MRYIPHTEQDIKQMLSDIGVNNVEQLFDSIPKSLRLKSKLLELPPSLPEHELTQYLKELQKRNTTSENGSIFWVPELIIIFLQY